MGVPLREYFFLRLPSVSLSLCPFAPLSLFSELFIDLALNRVLVFTHGEEILF